ASIYAIRILLYVSEKLLLCLWGQASQVHKM
ncbi:unnamed protein product, partial [marine sediment metagenome]